MMLVNKKSTALVQDHPKKLGEVCALAEEQGLPMEAQRQQVKGLHFYVVYCSRGSTIITMSSIEVCDVSA